MFDITGKTLKPVTEARSSDELERWWTMLVEEARAKKAIESLQHSMTSTEIEALARKVFEEVSTQAIEAGVTLPPEYILRLIGDLSGMGSLLELIARSDIEDIAINLGHIYVYTTTNGWEHVGPAPDGIGDALRVMIDRAGQRAPTPDYPIADAMLQVMVPLIDGTVRRKGVRINYIMPPASPYGDTITLRVSNYRTASDLEHGSLAMLCQKRLPPVPRPRFDAKDFPRGAIRLFLVEDSNEIILNGWNGDGKSDTGNIITVARYEPLYCSCQPNP